ncbi:RNA-directed DNA polymerase from mobile element jockey [Plakobranchus ocellatus]|uniref:RNA-directed DNA polymerase from mobile element jockey n=1 Tax=Plakobranchus ocellatus TaxID=259542 RepID=A0AAV4DE86_9GAST|nr:RNA-directed DNA polymerase from mobile element jockey [Plakobranchus ocellatus]
MAELKNSIVQSNESAAGPDGVYYQFLRFLPESCLHILLKLFNNIWTTEDISPSWREASVVPISKPGKDPSDPSNYWPIVLTSFLCKTLERMVNDRLVHVLESRNLLSKIQCGFRKDHSTLDHLVRLETFIKKAFAQKKQVLAVFSTLKKLTPLHGGNSNSHLMLTSLVSGISNSHLMFTSLISGIQRNENVDKLAKAVLNRHQLRKTNLLL